MDDVTGMSAPTSVIGKHTFETLTTGMYSDPLDCLREYVQNSVDSLEESGRLAEGRIDFAIDAAAKSVVIRDDGLGIPVSAAAATLLDIGRSEKPERSNRSRGFRGIGRLGGLAYCERLISGRGGRGCNETGVGLQAAAAAPQARSRSGSYNDRADP
jgi:hypothetical protein